jgi:membrane-bound lytic murein transglycosylase F
MMLLALADPLKRTNALLALRIAGWILLALALVTLSTRAPAMKQVRTAGVLRVAMVNDPTSYYLGPAGYTGFDYDLVRGFAEHLNVELDIVEARSTDAAHALVLQGNAHLAATASAVAASRSGQLRFSRPLRYRTPQLVARSGNGYSSDPAELDATIVVAEGSATVDWVRELAREHPGLQWEVRADIDTEALLQLVADNQLQLTVAGSDLVAITQRYYPRLRVLRDIGEPRPLAWALARENGRELARALAHFLRLMGGEEIARLRDRYFGHIDRLNYVDAVALATHYETRLPKYRERFEQAGAEHGIDWRLLAAVGYQESHWDNRAVSPTGVRGLMQITQQTAQFLDIEDRLDPAESIDGAARYLKSLSSRLPESIDEPDRSWFMLAAYNIGLGHVLDARRLTERMGGNPDHWVDVRRHLPLLTQPRYYKQLRYGYARGPEAVQYVGNIRTYYDMLVWLTEREGGTEPPAKEKEQDSELRPPPSSDPLLIEQPLL